MAYVKPPSPEGLSWPRSENTIRADERRRILNDICAIACNSAQLCQLIIAASDEPAGRITLARARRLLHELAADGGPLEVGIRWASRGGLLAGSRIEPEGRLPGARVSAIPPKPPG